MAITMKATPEAVLLSLHGDIGYEITTKGVGDALAKVGPGALTISINSYGGDAFAGFAIHNMLARHEGKKKVVIEGIAASAGSIIAMAGDEIVMPENAMMMIHAAHGLAMGEAEDMRQSADVLESITTAAARIYANRTGLSVEEIGALMAAETWLTAEDALARGFATSVAAPADIRLDARRLSNLPNLPAALLAITSPAAPAQTKDDRPMDPEITMAATPPAETAAATSVTAAPVRQPVPQSPVMATMEQIEAIATRSKLGADFVLAQMKAKATEQEARDAAIDLLASRGPQLTGAGRVQMVRDEGETKGRLMLNALAHKAGMKEVIEDADGNETVRPVRLEAGNNHFRGMTLVDMARESLNDRGVNTRGKTPWEIAELALSGNRFMMAGEHSSSDFPNILANTASKSLRAAYVEAPRTFVPWTQRNDLPDFKSFRPMVLNAAPSLTPIPENGSVEYGTIGEGAETWALARYGRALAIGYVAIVNDDMSAFTRAPALFAQAAARLESDIVYSALLANGNLADGGALFNNTAVTTAGGHFNLTSGGTSALTVDAAGITAVGALEERLGRQVAPGTNSPLNLRGRYLLVPTALGTAARQLFGEGYMSNTPGLTNPYASQYQVILEGRLQLGATVGTTTVSGSATGYYLIADGLDTIHWGYLRGETGPTLQSMADFDTDGMKIKVNHNFGAKAVEFRSMARSAGA
jgi:ATP-dependent protease ClpP protease subunit